MKQKIGNHETISKRKWPKWLRISLRVIGILLLLQVLFCIVVFGYVNTHKKEVLVMITEKLNENLNGKLAIESIEPTFFSSFPKISLHLKNLVIRDTMFQKHQKTFLEAGDFDIELNTGAFIRGTVEIYQISISNAAVNLFTDANGYSNDNVFKSNSDKGNDSPVYPELKKFKLDNVAFTIDNQKNHKLFQFKIDKINGEMNSVSGNWSTDFRLKALVKSLAFSTHKGSFIKDKLVDGNFQLRYESAAKTITVLPNKLDIGGEGFVISAQFTNKTASTDFSIHIQNDKILWKNAAHLLTPNIYSRLDMFSIKEPIAVRCDISGNFDEAGDPLIDVNAVIKDNKVTTPGGLLTDCNFTGIFTNNNDNTKGFNDANSAIKFENFNAKFSGLPIKMNHAAIINLEHPIAKGDFKSSFNLSQLSSIIDSRLLRFTKGTANVDLNFIADIVNYKIAKPIVIGTIAVKDGNIEYAPRKLRFTNTSVLLDFRNNDLFISNIHLQSGKSKISMEGNVRNFLNLYYTAPEKVVLNWKITSPEIHLAEFMEFLGTRKTTPVRKQTKNADFTENVNTLFEKSRVQMSLRVKKLFYNKFVASNVKADIAIVESLISVSNGGLDNSGGFIKFNASLAQKGKENQYRINAKVNHVDVSSFFYAFDNFGLESMNSKNLNGFLSAESGLSGKINTNGTLVPDSMLGNVDFTLSDGELINFDPIRKIGKYAFPHRDMNRILIQDLNGKFAVSGNKVMISPMQINSSILNMDIDGLYSFGKGTSINVSVPLRNPEKDKDITDPDELAKRRERGIVVRLLAADDIDGKVKIKLVSKKTQLREKNERESN